MRGNAGDVIRKVLESKRDKLEYIVEYLYKNPETSFNEEKASSALCDLLSREGFNVDMDVMGIKHSFKAQYGSKPPAVAYICEYDTGFAPNHALGRNVSSAINAGAAIGLRSVIDETEGSVLVIGCPAEGKHHTKIEMQEKGVFNGVDAVICGYAMDKTCESGSSLAMELIDFNFYGRPAHTSINFKEGINALSPCAMFLTLVETLKSKYTESVFINGVINSMNSDINVIPSEVKCTIMLKADSSEKLKDICSSLEECAEFAAKHHECTVEISASPAIYMPFKTNPNLSRIACHNLKENGIVEIHGPITLPASLDLGNISQEIPSVLPCIGICKAPIKYYTKEFSDATVEDYAKQQMLRAACALAITGADIIQKKDIIKGQD